MQPTQILFKFISFPLYYLIHNNYLFGIVQKIIIKKFYFKKFKFNLDQINLPTSSYSAFLWNTYELNDRIIIQRNINKKNKCIIIGGGIGFIAAIVYNLTIKKILIFEINADIIKLLRRNLIQNKIRFELFNKNLSISEKKPKKYFFDSKNFLSNSFYRKTKKSKAVKNISFRKIKNFNSYNTLIIDAEGVEEIFIKKIHKIPNVKYLYFEFHFDIFNEKKQKKLFRFLNKNNFQLKDKFINSYYFEKC